MKMFPARTYTGEVRFRTVNLNLFKPDCLILQVQIMDGPRKVWVDATVEDITRQKMPGAKP